MFNYKNYIVSVSRNNLPDVKSQFKYFSPDTALEVSKGLVCDVEFTVSDKERNTLIEGIKNPQVLLELEDGRIITVERAGKGLVFVIRQISENRCEKEVSLDVSNYEASNDKMLWLLQSKTGSTIYDCRNSQLLYVSNKHYISGKEYIAATRTVEFDGIVEHLNYIFDKNTLDFAGLSSTILGNFIQRIRDGENSNVIKTTEYCYMKEVWAEIAKLQAQRDQNMTLGLISKKFI